MVRATFFDVSVPLTGSRGLGGRRMSSARGDTGAFECVAARGCLEV